MDLRPFVGSWRRFVLRGGESIEGFLVTEDGQFGVAPLPGEAATAIAADDVIAVEAATNRPPFLNLTPRPGKRIATEGDVFEFLNQRVRIHWNGGGSSDGRLERSLILGGRLALANASQKVGESEVASTVEWQNMDRIERLG